MSLKDDYYQKDEFAIMDKTTKPDGYGGVKTKWVEGAHIEAAVEEVSTGVGTIAEAIAEKKKFVVFTKQNVYLQQGDAIKRLSDGQAFLITSDAEQTTPRGSTLNMRRCEAEETVLKDS